MEATRNSALTREFLPQEAETHPRTPSHTIQIEGIQLSVG